MEYSELVKAIEQEDRNKIKQLLGTLIPRMKCFLRIHMNAGKQDAEDCAQKSLLNALEVIREGNIRNAEHIVSFLLTSCRNNYLNLVKKNNYSAYENIADQHNQQPQQLSSLIDEERRQLLEWCIEQLSESYKTFIDYWFKHPDSDSKAASTHFGITVSNVWTRKHRVIKKLSECCQKKNDI